jgi:DNA-binding MarR family transcriptional regulator
LTHLEAINFIAFGVVENRDLTGTTQLLSKWQTPGQDFDGLGLEIALSRLASTPSSGKNAGRLDSSLHLKTLAKRLVRATGASAEDLAEELNREQQECGRRTRLLDQAEHALENGLACCLLAAVLSSQSFTESQERPQSIRGLMRLETSPAGRAVAQTVLFDPPDEARLFRKKDIMSIWRKPLTPLPSSRPKVNRDRFGCLAERTNLKPVSATTDAVSALEGVVLTEPADSHLRQTIQKLSGVSQGSPQQHNRGDLAAPSAIRSDVFGLLELLKVMTRLRKADVDFSLRELGVLIICCSIDEMHTFESVAKRLHAPLWAVSRAAIKFEQLGLLQRQLDPVGGRKWLVLSTAKAIDLFQSLQARFLSGAVSYPRDL